MSFVALGMLQFFASITYMGRRTRSYTAPDTTAAGVWKKSLSGKRSLKKCSAGVRVGKDRPARPYEEKRLPDFSPRSRRVEL